MYTDILWVIAGIFIWNTFDKEINNLKDEIDKLKKEIIK